ncbi:UDP-N-acetylglucosamine 4,6-dehydratase (inverting) (plasmid) [Streptomyces murinus]|uniref:UDP-N-acetylglucosamine 4,6-dehydratase (inverting) n=1 Tax=Streptomyces murinus TaxID=33900 RepID=UPI000A1E1515|nr:UDP-N-acetylglucosamine 4,6-dehydratase (inverting) [Streptomyces murinus]WDO11343.1 UDP-N-acetylglucosamine 4,6-dehydratase (inverting) [Streptomyces murinus]
MSASEFTDSTVLITGATGSLGKKFIERALNELGLSSIVVYSRDELKQSELREHFGRDPRLRWVIGDIRDRDRLLKAMHGVDFVVHAAALKQVDTAEMNAYEYIHTNVIGSQNVIDAAVAAGVRKVVALSTDKASSPVNLYGASKLCADKLFTSANLDPRNCGTRLCVVRYGNVLGSRGSAVPLFRRLAAKGKSLPITDKRMTRFWITLDQAVDFIIDSFTLMKGSELFVPRIPSMRVLDLAEAVAPGALTHEVGMRPGEKLHEEMISTADAARTYQHGDRYIVLPQRGVTDEDLPTSGRLPDGFCYRSDTNNQWLSAEDIRNILT